MYFQSLTGMFSVVYIKYICFLVWPTFLSGVQLVGYYITCKLYHSSQGLYFMILIDSLGLLSNGNETSIILMPSSNLEQGFH